MKGRIGWSICEGNGDVKNQKGSDAMASSAAVDTKVNNCTSDYTEKVDFDALYQELAKGVQNMKNGEIYSIQEAWEEIDRI